MASQETMHEFVPTTFRVTDFLGWQRDGSLDLNPRFQRRSVWKKGAKSFFIDTVSRGLPVPLVFLRERVDLASGTTVREVVDGQQRLRTLLGYIDPSCLADYSEDRDYFTVSRTHNESLAGRSFKELNEGIQTKILGYRFSVQVLPPQYTDEDVLKIFARLNSTGERLLPQELRNAAYFGELKTSMYNLAYKNLDRWLRWGVFSEDQMARMVEVEFTSDVAYNMMYGLSGKSQPRLDRFYRNFDDEFPQRDALAKQFMTVMDVLEDELDDFIRRSVFSREVHFFTLFMYTYDKLFDITSEHFVSKPAKLPRGYRRGVMEASRRFREWEVPTDVFDAVSRASADIGRRRTRMNFLAEVVEEASL